MLNMKPTPKYRPQKSACIDIDGTLVRDGQLNAALVEWIERKRSAGYDIVLWSARGRKYAEDVAAHYQIAHLFHAIISKPGVIVDDMGWRWTQYCRTLYNMRDADPPETTP